MTYQALYARRILEVTTNNNQVVRASFSEGYLSNDEMAAVKEWKDHEDRNNIMRGAHHQCIPAFYVIKYGNPLHALDDWRDGISAEIEDEEVALRALTCISSVPMCDREDAEGAFTLTWVTKNVKWANMDDKTALVRLIQRYTTWMRKKMTFFWVTRWLEAVIRGFIQPSPSAMRAVKDLMPNTEDFVRSLDEGMRMLEEHQRKPFFVFVMLCTRGGKGLDFTHENVARLTPRYKLTSDALRALPTGWAYDGDYSSTPALRAVTRGKTHASNIGLIYDAIAIWVERTWMWLETRGVSECSIRVLSYRERNTSANASFETCDHITLTNAHANFVGQYPLLWRMLHGVMRLNAFPWKYLLFCRLQPGVVACSFAANKTSNAHFAIAALNREAAAAFEREEDQRPIPPGLAALLAIDMDDIDDDDAADEPSVQIGGDVKRAKKSSYKSI